ncbi:MAG TPA: L-threonylcarbamoyladenylate synthase [Candidatus Paceibacterota bacterium]
MRLIEGNFLKYQDALVRAIKLGKIFIYPTDTIYGLGADATNAKAVGRIRELKHRETKPFLVAAPSLEWIWENCEVPVLARPEIEKNLPGRFAYFLKLKNRNSLTYNKVNPLGDGTLGVRFFDHAFQKVISAAGVPFVTTSVNLGANPHSETLEEMPPSIKEGVDYIIYEGRLAGPTSQKIDLTEF